MVKEHMFQVHLCWEIPAGIIVSGTVYSEGESRPETMLFDMQSCERIDIPPDYQSWIPNVSLFSGNKSFSADFCKRPLWDVEKETPLYSEASTGWGNNVEYCLVPGPHDSEEYVAIATKNTGKLIDRTSRSEIGSWVFTAGEGKKFTTSLATFLGPDTKRIGHLSQKIFVFYKEASFGFRRNVKKDYVVEIRDIPTCTLEFYLNFTFDITVHRVSPDGYLYTAQEDVLHVYDLNNKCVLVEKFALPSNIDALDVSEVYDVDGKLEYRLIAVGYYNQSIEIFKWYKV